MTCLLVAAALLNTHVTPARCGEFAIALIPPRDVGTTVSLVKAVGQELSAPVSEVAPEDFVDSRKTDPDRYPMAVYSGFERYIYTVNKPGDGAAALLNYVRSGGALLVAGQTWPFYRAVDYAGGEYVASRSGPPEFEGPEDAWLREQMADLNQTETGNFNRFVGLNISGEGTVQFESPDEEITFTSTAEGRELFPSLPQSFPFPGAGDLRFRPASAQDLQTGVSFTPVAVAKGESGKVYGPGMCVVRHESGGMVIYVWGTLLGTSIGRDIVRDAVLLAARETATPEEAEATNSVAARVDEFRLRALTLAEALAEPEPDDVLRRYLGREVARELTRLAAVEGMATVGQFEAADERVAEIDESLARLERRAEGAR